MEVSLHVKSLKMPIALERAAREPVDQRDDRAFTEMKELTADTERWPLVASWRTVLGCRWETFHCPFSMKAVTHR